MRILGRILLSLLIALVVGVIAGVLPFLWMKWADGEDMIFFILPLAAVFAVVVFGATFLMSLIVLLWRVK